MPRKYSNNYVSIFGNLQQVSLFYTDGSYSRHQIPASPFFSFKGMFTQKRQGNYCQNLYYHYCYYGYVEVSMMKKDIQHSMLDNSTNNKVTIHRFDQ